MIISMPCRANCTDINVHINVRQAALVLVLAAMCCCVQSCVSGAAYTLTSDQDARTLGQGNLQIGSSSGIVPAVEYFDLNPFPRTLQGITLIRDSIRGSVDMALALQGRVGVFDWLDVGGEGFLSFGASSGWKAFAKAQFTHPDSQWHLALLASYSRVQGRAETYPKASIFTVPQPVFPDREEHTLRIESRLQTVELMLPVSYDVPYEVIILPDELAPSVYGALRVNYVLYDLHSTYQVTTYINGLAASSSTSREERVVYPLWLPSWTLGFRLRNGRGFEFGLGVTLGGIRRFPVYQGALSISWVLPTVFTPQPKP